MTPCPSFLLILSLTPFSVFILHALVIRAGVLRGVSNQFAAFATIAAGYIPTAIAVWYAYLSRLDDALETVLSALFAFIVYSALAYSYFHIFNMSETARRIKILREIRRAGRISEAELSRAYNAKEMMEARLERLEMLKQVRFSGNRYFLDGGLFYFISKLMMLWASLIGLPFNGKSGRR